MSIKKEQLAKRGNFCRTGRSRQHRCGPGVTRAREDLRELCMTGKSTGTEQYPNPLAAFASHTPTIDGLHRLGRHTVSVWQSEVQRSGVEYKWLSAGEVSEVSALPKSPPACFRLFRQIIENLCSGRVSALNRSRVCPDCCGLCVTRFKLGSRGHAVIACLRNTGRCWYPHLARCADGYHHCDRDRTRETIHPQLE